MSDEKLIEYITAKIDKFLLRQQFLRTELLFYFVPAAKCLKFSTGIILLNHPNFQ